MREIAFEAVDGNLCRAPYELIQWDPNEAILKVVFGPSKDNYLFFKPKEYMTKAHKRIVDAVQCHSNLVDISECAECIGNVDPRDTHDDSTRPSPAPAPKNTGHHPEG